MSAREFKVITKKIGLVSAIALIIGNAIAVTMFILPADLLEAGAGPSIAPASAIAALPMVFGIFVMLQLGGAMPAAGGSYLYPSRLLSPYWGFVIPWAAVPAVWFGLVYTALGFAEYTRFYFPGLSLDFLILAVLVVFMVLNVIGIRMVAAVQLGMVAVIVLGMVLFIVAGAFFIDPSNYTPVIPEGETQAFLSAIVAFFIGMYGFNLAIEIGEEIENPIENVPRALMISAAIGISLMVLIVVVAVGVLHWSEWAGEDAGIAVVAETFLPDYGVMLLVVAAVLGGITTVNTLYITFSRQLMRAGRDEVIPKNLAFIHDRFQTPVYAILLLGVPPLFLIPFRPATRTMATGLALALLFLFILLSISVWRLPKLFPDRYEHSFYKLPLPALKFAAIGGAGSSAVFFLLTFLSRPELGALLLGWIALGYPVYRYRVWAYDKKGIDLRERMKGLDEHEKTQGSNEE